MITRDDIKPLPIKVQAIVDIKPPSNQKKLREFLGIVNFNKDLWPKRSIMLSPLTAMTKKPKGHPFIWTKECQDAFDGMKDIMIQDALIVYPKCGEPFDVHIDASDYQIGGVVSQYGKPVGYFPRKFNKAQMNCTVTVKELLTIMETLKNSAVYS